ncbi:MAG TPA: hypothetical protein VFR63_02780 [Gaiellaceae bacterium]|nr:hypothetical protein [Gaiellaceae bacterium]
MTEKSDYSPVVEQAPEPERRREGRFAKTFLLGAHAFWLYALLLAGVIVLVIYLLGGFGEGGLDR